MTDMKYSVYNNVINNNVGLILYMKHIEPYFKHETCRAVSNITISDKTFPHTYFPIAILMNNVHEADICIINVWNNDDNFEHSFKISVDGTDEEKIIKFDNSMFNENKCNIVVSMFNELKKVETKHNFPKNIFSTFETYDIQLKKYNSVVFNRLLNHNYDHYFFNNDDRRNMIKDNFDDNVLRAYDDLVPGAYRADIWRLCCLYLHGGIYIDDKFLILVNMDSILNNYDDYECLITDDFPTSGFGLYNGFMIAKPNCAFIKRCIDKIVENVNNHYYGNGPLDITGPIALRDVLNNYHDDNKLKTVFKFDVNDSYNNRDLVITNNDKILVCTNENHFAIKIFSHSNNWSNRDVYKTDTKEKFTIYGNSMYICNIYIFVLLFLIIFCVIIILAY